MLPARTAALPPNTPRGVAEGAMLTPAMMSLITFWEGQGEGVGQRGQPRSLPTRREGWRREVC